tara:strand:+ start:362 stop:1447 length:1086 start_codon:yes stop_codon:yes gene_type:complete
MSQINVDIIRSRTGTAATCDKGLVVSGVTTSTSFTGDVTGNVTGNASGTAGGLTGSPDVTIGNLTGVAGTYSGVVKVTDSTEATNTTTGSVIITGGVGIAKSLFVGGNISVGGTLTYEDVQNVDSIGIITARDDINIVTDSKKLNIGAGADLQLYHNASHSFINNSTGNLNFQTSGNIWIENQGGTKVWIKALEDQGVEIYYNNTKRLETTAHGAITSGIHTVTVGTDLDGYKVEEGNSDTSTALNGEFDFELENGHVQRYSTATGGNYFPDFRVSSSQSLNSVMDVGDVVSVTLMVASSSHYCTTGIKIDNSTSNLDIDWIGGAAPSAANGSGYDIYAFTIQKTGAAPAYHIIGNTLGAA